MMKKGYRFVFSLAILPLLFSGSGCQDGNLVRSAPQANQWRDRLDNFTDWGIYRGDKRGYQYSALSQINRENVHLLEPVWEYEARELSRPSMQSNPLVIDGLMYFADPVMNLVALDAATGVERWLFDPRAHHDDEELTTGQLLRGVTYWEDEEGGNRRIFHFVRDIVFAVDPDTGTIIESFGRNGYIDLKENHVFEYDDLDGLISVTSPGITYRNHLIIGFRTNEGNVSAPGDIRSFDTMTGEYQWTFHTVPLEGQYGHDTWEWEEGMVYGANNPWGGFTVDEERGWVFAATGAPAGMFFSGMSRKGANLFGNSVLALDASTGERIWHYQVICHDIWDYDVPPPPMLATINSGGVSRDVVVQTGKHPTMFVFDRDTGEPVFPVIDKPVPRDAVPGEQPCATQPWPLHPDPLVRTSMYESDITRITAESHAYVLERFRQLRTGPTYTPASIEGTIAMPGVHGGNQWGGGSFDPETNIVYVNVNNVPFILRLDPIPPDQFEEMTAVQRARHIYTANCAVCHGPDRQGNPGVPPLVDLPYSTGELRTIVAEGFGNMPAFPNLSDSQLEELVAYLESDAAEVDAAGFDPAAEIGGELTWSGSGGRADLEWTTTTPQYVNSLSYFTDHMGLPAIQPPWGELVAVDIAEGQILWKVPLGEYPVLVDSLGIRNTGTENLGGLVATAGGLIFVAATKDSKFRAFDKSNGQVLWEFQMDAPGFSSPSVYEIDGRQYVAIVAGGGARRFRAPQVAPGIGRKVHVFALPE